MAWSRHVARLDDGRVVKSSSGDSRFRVKSEKYSELDIGGRVTCHHYQGQGSRE